MGVDEIALNAAREILGINRSMPVSQYKARIQVIIADAIRKAQIEGKMPWQ